MICFYAFTRSYTVMPEPTYSPTAAFTKPVPTKFRMDEKEILSAAKRATGFSHSELIRRAVRLLGRQARLVQSHSFLLDLTPGVSA